jgi:hypothetical protein
MPGTHYIAVIAWLLSGYYFQPKNSCRVDVQKRIPGKANQTTCVTRPSNNVAREWAKYHRDLHENVLDYNW